MSARDALSIAKPVDPDPRHERSVGPVRAVQRGGHLIAGLDLGGTKIAAAIAHRDGLIARSRRPVPADAQADDLLVLMRDLIDECCTQAGISTQDIAALGVSSCGPFGRDAQGGLTVLAPNLPRARRSPAGGQVQVGLTDAASACGSQSAGIALARGLAVFLPALTIVNDAAAALLAEQRFGVLRGVDDCAYLTWSTGIGFGLMCDGRLLRGKRGNAGHAGHAVAVAPLASDPVCGCGNVGDLESLAGGAALARAWGDSPESLCAAARRGEHRARALLDRALDAVSAALYNLIVTLDLERIAVGGGLFCAQRDLLLEPLRERVFADPRRCGLSTMLESVRIEPVADPARTAELGALCIVMPADWAPSGFRH